MRLEEPRKNRANRRTNVWSASRPVASKAEANDAFGGTTWPSACSTPTYSWIILGSYFGSRSASDAISVRHSNAAFRNCAAAKKRSINVLIKSVSKRYPKGIQDRKALSVLKVAEIELGSRGSPQHENTELEDLRELRVQGFLQGADLGLRFFVVVCSRTDTRRRRASRRRGIASPTASRRRRHRLSRGARLSDAIDAIDATARRVGSLVRS